MSLIVRPDVLQQVCGHSWHAAVALGVLADELARLLAFASPAVGDLEPALVGPLRALVGQVREQSDRHRALAQGLEQAAQLYIEVDHPPMTGSGT